MTYEKALEIIESEFETLKESSHNKIVRTNMTYNGYNSFCVSIYNCNGIAILTDLGTTKDVFDEVAEEEWRELCQNHGFEFNHWSIRRDFNKIEDLYDYIEFLDFISRKYWDDAE